MTEIDRSSIIAVAMSGGVDSSVAAAILKNNSYDIVGITMRVWSGDVPNTKSRRHACYGPGEEEDIEDAKFVAKKLNIPLQIIDLKNEYQSTVLDYFKREYIMGRTPNPCVKCNRYIKFKALLKEARKRGIDFDYIATGHYARVEYDDVSHRYMLKKGCDESKDQSYFLYTLSQEQLAYTIFPVGEYLKEDVKSLAAKWGLSVFNKPESQNFIDGEYNSFFKEEAKPGPIINNQGDIIGQHKGIPFYTIGQRKGLGISAEQSLYVTDIDRFNNTVKVGFKEELYKSKFIVTELNWIIYDKLSSTIEAKAKIRSNHKEAEASIIPLEKDRLLVVFREPQLAITPGQSIVFYKEDLVLGGGTIESVES